MVAQERRVIVEVPSHREVVEKVKREVLRLVSEKIVEFQEDQFVIWFGKPWQMERGKKEEEGF